MRRQVGRIVDILASLVVLLVLFRLLILPRFFAPPVSPAPPFALAALDGPEFRLRDQHGKLVFLDFWASWCDACKASLPLVERYARTHPEVRVIAVDSGEAPEAGARYARENGLRAVAFDPDERVAHAYGVMGFPTIVVIDPQGDVRAVWPGLNPAVELAMEHARKTLGSSR